MSRNTSIGLNKQSFSTEPAIEAIYLKAAYAAPGKENILTPSFTEVRQQTSATPLFPRRSFQQHQDHAVDHRCQCPKGDDRPGYGEHLRRHTGDESLGLEIQRW